MDSRSGLIISPDMMLSHDASHSHMTDIDPDQLYYAIGRFSQAKECLSSCLSDPECEPVWHNLDPLRMALKHADISLQKANKAMQTGYRIVQQMEPHMCQTEKLSPPLQVTAAMRVSVVDGVFSMYETYHRMRLAEVIEISESVLTTCASIIMNYL